MAAPNPDSLCFQDLILTLQRYWSERGCLILQPYDTEVGAGTLHPSTVLRALGPKPWRAAYVQPSRRPADGRYGENPNRLGHYYQFQVILKPNPPDLQDLYLGSLRAIGIDPLLHDVRFVEDDWENPTVGAWGLGWEVWCDGMEVTQFTYFQGVGGHRGGSGVGRAHLRARAPGHVCAGRRQRLRPSFQRRGPELSAKCSWRTSARTRPSTSKSRRRGDPETSVRGHGAATCRASSPPRGPQGQPSGAAGL